MRDYVRVRGIQGLHARVDRLLIAAPRFQAHASKTPILIGHHAGRPGWFGLGVPFGSAPHSTWSVVADLAERFGQAAIRLTPARVILLPGVSARAAAMLTDLAEQCGLITREQDPRRRVIACAGAPACASACGETRVLATSLAAQLRERLIAGATLHVSGCGKACASDAAAAVTLVLAEGGAQLGFDADVAAARAQPIEPLARACDRILAQCVQGSVTADEGTAAALATPLDAKGALA
jgi:precorrin-3B synthase